jgi:hypothetical protein
VIAGRPVGHSRTLPGRRPMRYWPVARHPAGGVGPVGIGTLSTVGTMAGDESGTVPE